MTVRDNKSAVIKSEMETGIIHAHYGFNSREEHWEKTSKRQKDFPNRILPYWMILILCSVDICFHSWLLISPGVCFAFLFGSLMSSSFASFILNIAGISDKVPWIIRAAYPSRGIPEVSGRISFCGLKKKDRTNQADAGRRISKDIRICSRKKTLARDRFTSDSRCLKSSHGVAGGTMLRRGLVFLHAGALLQSTHIIVSRGGEAISTKFSLSIPWLYGRRRNNSDWISFPTQIFSPFSTRDQGRIARIIYCTSSCLSYITISWETLIEPPKDVIPRKSLKSPFP